ncbi:MAG: KamA family radical SAM protein [Syntrophales bacterium]|nr:KamA family radical SAM protein [Syntrophales bacterium]
MTGQSEAGSPWRGVSERDWNNWRWQLSHGLREPASLPVEVWGQGAAPDGIARVTANYPLCVTPYYLSLMGQGGLQDPIALQCVPQVRELDMDISCEPDPLREEAAMPVPALVHRYTDRCLVMVTRQCAVHCRHCNRKRRWKRGGDSVEQIDIGRMVEYVSSNRKIREVIFSGGDPLIWSDGKLDALLGAFRAIPHVEILRIGSRIPVVMPMRITRALCRIFKRHRPVWFNTQFNHASEITPESARACEMLLEAGIPVSNQSVLLRGVNDTLETMKDLLYGLQRVSVRPYYLFQCEPVTGAAHFMTEINIGIAMMKQIWRECSGLCQPAYVLDTADGRGKVPLTVHSSLSSGGLA